MAQEETMKKKKRKLRQKHDLHELLMAAMCSLVGSIVLLISSQQISVESSRSSRLANRRPKSHLGIPAA